MSAEPGPLVIEWCATYEPAPDPPRLWWIHEPVTFRPIQEDKPCP